MEISPLAGVCFSSLGLALIMVLLAFIRGSRGLRSYIVTRVLLTVPMVLILVTVIFFVMRVIPGDPVTSELGPRGGAEVRERMRHQLGLDKPVAMQYLDYLTNIA